MLKQIKISVADIEFFKTIKEASLIDHSVDTISKTSYEDFKLHFNRKHSKMCGSFPRVYNLREFIIDQVRFGKICLLGFFLSI